VVSKQQILASVLDEWNTGDIDCEAFVLQERQKKIRELADVRSRESSRFDALIDTGEKLYTHTSPDGREIIRQQLRYFSI
jgi:hypothetical protein